MLSHNFPAHGEIDVSIDKNILVVSGEGPVNIELIDAYCEKAKEISTYLEGQLWASLVLLKGVPLMPPEATNLVRDRIAAAQTQGLVASAVVFLDVEFAVTVKQFWQTIYEPTSLNIDFFSDEMQARQWLKEQISRLSPIAS